jgi:hypothetical protein
MAPRLAQLSEEQLQAIEQMTRALVNKLQHAPIQAIKRAAQEGDRDTLAVIETVFDLEHHANETQNAVAAEKAESATPHAAVVAPGEAEDATFAPTADATRADNPASKSAAKAVSVREDCLP